MFAEFSITLHSHAYTNNMHNMVINQCDKHVTLYSTLVDKGITQGFEMLKELAFYFRYKK